MNTNAHQRQAPLIPESLVRFYRRMAMAWRSPAPLDVVAIARLSGIVELHHCVATAIQAAIERSEPDRQEHLRHLHSEQTRLAHAVGELVAELGGSPSRPDESSSELPRVPRAMSFARNQQQLIGLVHENLNYLASAHQEMASLPELPLTMRHRLETARNERVLLGSLKRMVTISQDIDSCVDWHGRVKTNHSASRKMLRHRSGIYEILDIIGIRAVTGHVHDCYRLIQRLHSEFPVQTSEFDDYIAAPKPNGYSSLHTIIFSPCGLPIEVQVRTHAMHAHAENGAASHVRYKQQQAMEVNRG